MQKTKLGISVGLLAAAIYFMGLFSGYTVVVLLAGYVLLREENDWLKKSAVKAVALMVIFSLVSAIVNLIPNAISCIDYFVSMFGGSFYISFVSNLVSLINSSLNILEKIAFILLGLKALKEQDFAIPALDKLVEKYMG